MREDAEEDRTLTMLPSDSWREPASGQATQDPWRASAAGPVEADPWRAGAAGPVEADPWRAGAAGPVEADPWRAGAAGPVEADPWGASVPPTARDPDQERFPAPALAARGARPGRARAQPRAARGRRRRGGQPSPASASGPAVGRLAQLPYLAVLAVGLGGLAWMWQPGAHRVRGGTLAIACALFVAALARLVLPESRAGMLASRGRLMDVVTLAALATGLTVAGLVLPTPS